MKPNLIIPIMFVAVFVLLTVSGTDFVASWKSFLIGIIFTLSVLDIGKELLRRVKRW